MLNMFLSLLTTTKENKCVWRCKETHIEQSRVYRFFVRIAEWNCYITCILSFHFIHKKRKNSLSIMQKKTQKILHFAPLLFGSCEVDYQHLESLISLSFLLHLVLLQLDVIC